MRDQIHRSALRTQVHWEGLRSEDMPLAVCNANRTRTFTVSNPAAQLLESVRESFLLLSIGGYKEHKGQWHRGLVWNILHDKHFSNQGDQLQGGQDLTTQLLKRAAAKIPITPRVSPNIMSHDNRTSRAEKPKLRNTWWKFEQFHKLHQNDVTQERTSRAGQLTVVENLASFCWQPLVVSHWWINFKKT